MQRLAGVLLHVDAGDADAHGAAAGTELDRAAGRERPLVLRDLVALGQVGIEVVLAREDRRRVDRAAERQRGARGELDGAPVQHRQRARQAEADRAERGVRSRAEPRGAAAEDLGGGQQLRVDLEADDRLKCGHVEPDCIWKFGNLEIWKITETSTTNSQISRLPKSARPLLKICDDGGVELRAGAALELEHRLARGDGVAEHPRARHRVEGVGDGR